MPAAKPKLGYYKARQTFGMEYQGEQITIPEGEPIPAGHPVLKKLGPAGLAEHFVEVEHWSRWDAPGWDRPARPAVEKATAAPGEKRGAK